MKKIIIFQFILFFVVVGCSQKVGFFSLSNQIYESQGGKDDKSTFKTASYKLKARNMAYNMNRQNFLYSIYDTIFVVESYNIENADLYGTIFTNKSKINYLNNRKEFKLLNESGFTDYQLKLVAKWDTIQIRKEESVNGIYFAGSMLNASKCYMKNGKWIIENIYFNDFYNPKRGY